MSLRGPQAYGLSCNRYGDRFSFEKTRQRSEWEDFVRIVGSLIGGLMASVASLPVTASAQVTWQPQHTVEIVAQSAPGGGTDITARLVQKIWRTNNILSAPSNVVNKAGCGGSVALAYMQRHAHDGHYIEIASTALLTSHITGADPYNF